MKIKFKENTCNRSHRHLRSEDGEELDFTNTTLTFGGKKFAFDKVLVNVDQEKIYQVIRPAVECVLEGKKATVLVYGQTGSGKTYTMTGITERAVNEIFQSNPSD